MGAKESKLNVIGLKVIHIEFVYMTSPPVYIVRTANDYDTNVWIKGVYSDRTTAIAMASAFNMCSRRDIYDIEEWHVDDTSSDMVTTMKGNFDLSLDHSINENELIGDALALVLTHKEEERAFQEQVTKKTKAKIDIARGDLEPLLVEYDVDLDNLQAKMRTAPTDYESQHAAILCFQNGLNSLKSKTVAGLECIAHKHGLYNWREDLHEFWPR